jgi:hypothetical protein
MYIPAQPGVFSTTISENMKHLFLVLFILAIINGCSKDENMPLIKKGFTMAISNIRESNITVQ